MDTGRISARYAKAAYEYALEQKEEERLYGEMKTLADSFSEFSMLSKAMEDPTLPTEEKLKLLTIASGIRLSKSCESLLNLVISHHRTSYMHFIALMYQEYYRKEKGMLIAKLTTTRELPDEVKDQLRGLIKGDYTSVDFISKEDKDIIGGFVLELNDQRLDASVKNQLNLLKQELKL